MVRCYRCFVVRVVVRGSRNIRVCPVIFFDTISNTIICFQVLVSLALALIQTDRAEVITRLRLRLVVSFGRVRPSKFVDPKSLLSIVLGPFSFFRVVLDIAYIAYILRLHSVSILEVNNTTYTCNVVVRVSVLFLFPAPTTECYLACESQFQS